MTSLLEWLLSLFTDEPDTNSTRTQPQPKKERHPMQTTQQPRNRKRNAPYKQPHNGNGPFNRHGADRIGLVGFHTRSFVIAKPADPFAHWLQQRVQSLPDKATGMRTNVSAGLQGSLDILQRAPKGVRKRIWLLSDGLPNEDVNRLPSLVTRAYKQRVNINTIQFGDRTNANEQLLRDVAANTHNGQFYQIDSLRGLKEAFLRSAKPPQRNPKAHVSETTVFCVDLSLSMTGPMEGSRKIDVLVEALITLLEYKQRMWS